MNIALWVLQVLLGLFFVFHFFIMVRPSPGGMKYILEMPAGLRLFAGIAEGLAGAGVSLPPLLHVPTRLTPLTAVGLVVLMLGAIVFHIRRREYPNVGFNAVLGLLAAVIAWGRFGPSPF